MGRTRARAGAALLDWLAQWRLRARRTLDAAGVP